MSHAEKDFTKKIDETILHASKKTLRKLQQIDIQTQLEKNTFYDAYLESSHHKVPHSKAKVFDKSKHL